MGKYWLLGQVEDIPAFGFSNVAEDWMNTWRYIAQNLLAIMRFLFVSYSFGIGMREYEGSLSPSFTLLSMSRVPDQSAM